MAGPFRIPESGLRLVDRTNAEKSQISTQILRLQLAQLTADQILKSIRNDEKIRLHFGKEQALQYGNNRVLLHAKPETCISEVYRSSKDDSEAYFFWQAEPQVGN